MIRTALISLCVAAPAHALTLEACTRTTHVSHGGEAGHRDLGGTRVAWVEWWSQEGVYTDFKVADCAKGELLTSRLREERIKDRVFDRRVAGRKVMDRHARRDAALFSLGALAADLEAVGEDTRIETMDAEPCGCAAAYPETRGALAPFVLN